MHFLTLKSLTTTTPFCASYVMVFIIVQQSQSLSGLPKIVFSIPSLLKLQIGTWQDFPALKSASAVDAIFVLPKWRVSALYNPQPFWVCSEVSQPCLKVSPLSELSNSFGHLKTSRTLSLMRWDQIRIDFFCHVCPMHDSWRGWHAWCVDKNWLCDSPLLSYYMGLLSYYIGAVIITCVQVGHRDIEYEKKCKSDDKELQYTVEDHLYSPAICHDVMQSEVPRHSQSPKHSHLHIPVAKEEVSTIQSDFLEKKEGVCWLCATLLCLLASFLTHSIQSYSVTTNKRTIVCLILCTQYFSFALCGRYSVKCNSFMFWWIDLPHPVCSPSVVATHICLESGAANFQWLNRFLPLEVCVCVTSPRWHVEARGRYSNFRGDFMRKWGVCSW